MTLVQSTTLPPQAHLSQRRKIALVIRSLAGAGGGAERLFCELANILAEEGFDVTCLHFDDVEGRPFFALRDDVTRINLSATRPVSLSPSRYRRYIRAALARLVVSPLGPLVNRAIWQTVNGQFVRQLATYYKNNRPDAVISFLPPANTPALYAAGGTTIPVIPTNHNVPEEDFASPRRWDPSPYDRKLRLELLDRAAAVHVLSSRFVDWFPAHLRPKVVVVPNYVSETMRHAPVASVRDKVILGVGRLVPAKNYQVLLDAWELLAPKYPDWSVRIYGTGRLKGKLEAQIAARGLDKSFQFPGLESNLSAVYARASIFCHPALFEGFGLVAAEALALGVPVVAFADCAGLDEYVVDGVNGIMVDRAEGAVGLAAALERLMLSEELRSALAGRAPASVEKYSEAEYRGNWLRLLDRVLPS